jgi:CRISPR-associated endonuclease/helicase Cas3
MSVAFNRQIFVDYFQELHGHTPFPWQERLARTVVEEGWPAVIDLPTASGKTACIDIAVFALANGNGARRILFVVDRKVIVDEAYRRAERIAEKLREAKDGALWEIAKRLRSIAGDENGEPLRCFQLRGGIYRDESWVANPLQATVVTSTVDQVGSRLLFRGYGVSPGSQPIHAGMTGRDALLLLDEAHCSKAFAQTLERVQRYQGPEWREAEAGNGFRFVEMTATPSRSEAGSPFRLSEEDRAHAVMGERLQARKWTRWVNAKAKTDEAKKLAPELVKQARAMGQKEGVKRIAVIVNRVETARRVADELAGESVTLVIGRMRPVDRRRVEEELTAFHSGTARGPEDPVRYVVATQSLEVGADLDFDGMVTELASIDALLQRFGRLNRMGRLAGGGCGTIVAPAADAKKGDAIYGDALVKTREWLTELFGGGDGERDFSIAGAPDTIPGLWRGLPAEAQRAMTPAAAVCPALLPAHLDALVQTSPRPEPEPAVEYFLHGKQAGSAEVNVVWRSEVKEEDVAMEAAAIALCPPTSGEALPVKLWAMRAWMEGRSAEGQSELEGVDGVEIATEGRRKATQVRGVLVWREGEASECGEARELRAGDTVILPASLWPIPELGYVPANSTADVAEEAYLQGRNKLRLRLHDTAMGRWPSRARERFAGFRKTDGLVWSDVQEAARAGLGSDDLPGWLRESMATLANPASRARMFQMTPYENGGGWLIESKKTLMEIEEDDGHDLPSRGEPVSLVAHTANVQAMASRYAEGTLDAAGMEAVRTASHWHDAGKIDERFQTLLFGGDEVAAQLSPVARAKGEFSGRRNGDSGLPKGFRHELGSLQLAEAAGITDATALHLIASHHGYCRPFAPVVLDDNAEEMAWDGATVSSETRRNRPTHRLDSGVAERFWRLTRRYGWWGLAYVEAVFRLGDRKASALEQKGRLRELEREKQA